MQKNMIKKCSLCDMTFENKDPDYDKRIGRHSIFHKTARVQGRNTAQGDPKYE